MTHRTIHLGEFAGRKAAALTEDGRLSDLLVDPLDATTPVPGAIYKARVARPLKGQGGVIADLGAGQHGFLRNVRGLAPGQMILIQIGTYAESGKAAPAGDRLIFKGRTAIVTPGAGGTHISRNIKDDDARLRLADAADTDRARGSDHGIILRTDAILAPSDDIGAEVDDLLNLADQVLADPGQEPELLVAGPGAHETAWRDWSLGADEVIEDDNAFEDDGLLTQIEALADPVELLRSGSFYVEPTRALVAVDINTGGDTSPAAGLKANLAAIEVLPRALRLRGLGGQITLDLAPTPKQHRTQIEGALKRAFRADAVETNLVGWTPLGHFEMTRKRARLPLTEALKR